MAKSKTEKTAIELLEQAFQEELNDQELQQRFDGFNKRLNDVKSQYNPKVPIINELINKRNSLSSIIFDSTLEGIIAKEAIDKYKLIDNDYQIIAKEIKGLQESMDEIEELIKKYQDLSERKLFCWWKSFKAIDPKGTQPWLEWKKPYNHKII
jgi:hypothetical protein